MGGRCGFPLQRRAPSLEARSTRGQAASDRTKPGPGAAGAATWAKSRACASRHRTGGGWLHVCEGEVTALAPAVQCALLGEGFAIATGGAAGFRVSSCRDRSGQAPGANPYRPGPGGGGARGESLLRKLRETGRAVEADGLYRLDKSGMGAADGLAIEVGERASILEHDGGLSRDESERKAGGGCDGRVASREVGAMSSKEREARAGRSDCYRLSPWTRHRKRIFEGAGGAKNRRGGHRDPPRPDLP